MLVLGQKKEPQRIVLREAVPPAPAVKKGRTIVTPATEGEPEAFVVMAPITQSMIRRAARVVARVFGQITDVSVLDIEQLYDRSELGSLELIRMGVVEWGGLGGPDGKPLALTPDRDTRIATAADEQRPAGSVDLLLEDDAIVAKITNDYVRPDAQRRAEKNALSGSPNGTSVLATPANATASSPANRRARRAAAKSARTASRRSKAKPAKASGKR